MITNERFIRVYCQGTINLIEAWIDRATGVNYVFRSNGHGGGLTPLLGKDGKPIVSNVQ